MPGPQEIITTLGLSMRLDTRSGLHHRCMFESNFPPDKVSFSHHVLFNAFKRFSKGYSAAEALFHDTAVRAYRISDG